MMEQRRGIMNARAMMSVVLAALLAAGSSATAGPSTPSEAQKPPESKTGPSGAAGKSSKSAYEGTVEKTTLGQGATATTSWCLAARDGKKYSLKGGKKVLAKLAGWEGKAVRIWGKPLEGGKGLHVLRAKLAAAESAPGTKRSSE